jgi:hypothetical protein
VCWPCSISVLRISAMTQLHLDFIRGSMASSSSLESSSSTPLMPVLIEFQRMLQTTSMLISDYIGLSSFSSDEIKMARMLFSSLILNFFSFLEY